MDYINFYGLVIMVIIMVPNVVFAIKVKNFESKYHNKTVEIIEQAGVLTLLYCIVWISYFRQSTKTKAMALAILPTIIFLFSGIILSQVLLIVTALLFGIGHITMTYYDNK